MNFENLTEKGWFKAIPLLAIAISLLTFFIGVATVIYNTAQKNQFIEDFKDREDKFEKNILDRINDNKERWDKLSSELKGERDNNAKLEKKIFEIDFALCSSSNRQWDHASQTCINKPAPTGQP